MATAHALEVVGVQHKGRLFLPDGASPAKVDVLRAYGDAVALEFVPGGDCVRAEAAAGRYAAEQRALYISPCDNFDVMSGNGTIAVEILETLVRVRGAAVANDAVTVYCCVGGGGMVSGVAAYLHVHAPAWQVVGCQPAASAVMAESVKAGRVVHIESFPTLSDGSAGGLEDGACVRGSRQTRLRFWPRRCIYCCLAES